MRKHIIPLIISCLFLSAITCSAAEKPVSIIIDGVLSQFDQDTGIPYINTDSRTMAPLRACLYSIGCSVDWDQQTKTVFTSKGDVTVAIPVGGNEIRVNDAPIIIDTKAVVIDGRTYLPLRAVMNAYGYAVEWEADSRTVYVTELTPFNINGGLTGAFQRQQLDFSGFDGIQADFALPYDIVLEKGDCPYVYFGFDWADDKGNAEGGFQFIEDASHQFYNQWTVYLRQGDEWSWGNSISLDQGSNHHLKFYADRVSDSRTDLVIELDGKEVIRKESAVTNFNDASAKTVAGMAMTKHFDGQNCFSSFKGAKISSLKVRSFNNANYTDFSDYALYSDWRASAGGSGVWYGTAVCVPSYVHIESDGIISVY